MKRILLSPLIKTTSISLVMSVLLFCGCRGSENINVVSIICVCSELVLTGQPMFSGRAYLGARAMTAQFPFVSVQFEKEISITVEEETTPIQEINTEIFAKLELH